MWKIPTAHQDANSSVALWTVRLCIFTIYLVFLNQFLLPVDVIVEFNVPPNPFPVKRTFLIIQWWVSQLLLYSVLVLDVLSFISFHTTERWIYSLYSHILRILIMLLLSCAPKTSCFKCHIYETHHSMHFQIFFIKSLFTRFLMENMPKSLELRISVAVIHKELDISSQG
jgi:hypothetical protein